MEKALAIKVDDGLRKIPITNNENEEIGVFYFRPTDIGIIERYKTLSGKFEEVIKPLEDVSINPDGTPADPSDEAQVKALKDAQDRLNTILNELFGGNFAEAFFGKMNPFSPVGGRFYCETAIEAVGDFISSQFEAETKSMSKNVEKYTDRYKKK